MPRDRSGAGGVVPGAGTGTGPQPPFRSPMRALATTLLLVLLGPTVLPAQSREETLAFLADEIKSLGDKDVYYREVSLSPDGRMFTLRRSVRGQTDKGLVLPLDQVDIYLALDRQAKGYEWYDLKVRTRGQEATLTYNGQPYRGTKTLFRFLYDERKAMALDQAFQRLIDRPPGHGRRAPDAPAGHPAGPAGSLRGRLRRAGGPARLPGPGRGHGRGAPAHRRPARGGPAAPGWAAGRLTGPIPSIPSIVFIPVPAGPARLWVGAPASRMRRPIPAFALQGPG